MLGQLVAGWVRAAMPALAGAAGLAYGSAVDAAVGTVVAWVVAGVWSSAQKKGWIKF